MAKYGELGNIGCYKGKGKHGDQAVYISGLGQGIMPELRLITLSGTLLILDQWCTQVQVIYGDFGQENNGQNPVGIKGDTVCSLSVLQSRRPAAGIRDQSRIVIKCEILRVDINANPCRFWAKGKVFIATFVG